MLRHLLLAAAGSDRLGRLAASAPFGKNAARRFVAGADVDAALAAGLVPAAEVSVKLSALGQRLDERLAYEHAQAVCAAATEAGTTVTLDAEDHTLTDSTLEILAELRKDHPGTGAVLQAHLRRTEG